MKSQLSKVTRTHRAKANDEIAALVQALLARKATGGAVAELEAAIDGAVCRLFGVGAGEIGMITNNGSA